MNQVLLAGVQRLEQGGREAARRAQAGAGGDVRHAGDLQVRHVDIQQPQRLADDGVLDLIDARRRAPCLEYLMISSGTKV